MIHRARSLVTVLALSLPPGVAVADRPADPTSVYLQQDRYTYCDVKVLAALWKQSIDDAKARVGAKLQARAEKYLDGQLVLAHKDKSARCTFAEAGFTYDDAQRLAKLWKKTAAAAKTLAEDKIAAGGEKTLRTLLKKTANEDPTTTFLKQDRYTYCDVKLLSARWKASLGDAKARIGAKLQAGASAFLDTELAAARRGTRVRCTYADAGFSFDDIEKLAKAWGTTPDRVKAKVEQKVAASGSAAAHAVYGTTQATNPNDAEIAVFLRQNRFTYCDAKMLAALWKKSVDDAKAFIGAKLQANSVESVKSVVNSARENARKNASARCTFAEAGFSFDDAQKLAKLWGMTAAKAKATVELKIAGGLESSIRAQLNPP